MWLPNNVVAEVGRVARVHYVNVTDTQRWNQHRQDGELRLLTGWCWSERGGQGRFRQGFKSVTVCYRDAWYSLVANREAPPVQRRWRVVSDRRSA